jgi:enediyne biosynthesis protein E4
MPRHIGTILLLLLAVSTARADDWPEFTDIIEDAGVRSYGTTFSAAIDDFNGDDVADLLVTRTPGLLTYELVRGGESMMFFQDTEDGVGTLTFEEVGDYAGVAKSCENRCLYLADYDGDGDQDIYNSVAQRNELYRANGDGTFEEVARDVGVDSDWTSHEGFWFDYDRDGLLDLFFTNGPKLGSLWNILYHNEGNGRFREVTDEAGVEGTISGKGACFLDFDEDGWLDIFTSNGLDCRNYLLYRNNQDGTFTEMSEELGMETGDNDQFLAWALCFDYDNDARMDILVGSHGIRWPRNTIWHGLPDGQFEETAEEMGVLEPYDGSACMIGDVDNDGWLDIVFGQRDYPYIPMRNNQDGTFTAVEGAGGIDNAHEAPNWTMSPGDLNGDGALDFYLGNGRANKPATDHLFLSSGNDNHYLWVSAEGTSSHRSGCGARITVKAGDLVQTRWQCNRRVTCSGPPGRKVHFGMGDHEVADEIEILFPNGVIEKRYDVPTDQWITITEHEPEAFHDEDRDGVPDLGDICPWTPGLSLTDTNGCAEFEGGDGTERIELVGPDDMIALVGAMQFSWWGNMEGYVLQFDDESSFDWDRVEIGPLSDLETEVDEDTLDELYERFGDQRVYWRVVASTDEVVIRTRVREFYLPADTNVVGIIANDINTWDPAHLQVNVGETVTWHIPTEEEGNINRFTHDVLLTDLEGNIIGRSEYLEPFDGRNEYVYTFDEPGLYYLTCVFHGWSGGHSHEFELIGEGQIEPGPYPCHSGSVHVVEP